MLHLTFKALSNLKIEARDQAFCALYPSFFFPFAFAAMIREKLSVSLSHRVIWSDRTWTY